MTTLAFRCRLPVSPADAFAWHERPGAFARLTPPWENVRVLAQTGGIGAGARVSLESKVGPLAVRWEIEHRDYLAGRQFVDEQRSGPFAAWRHEHLFVAAPDGGTELTDRVIFALPGAFAGELVAGGYVRRRLERLFAYRHAVTLADLEQWARWKNSPRLRVALTGGSGLVGRALAPLLRTQGHEVTQFVRRTPRAADEASWDPTCGAIDEAALGRCDAVVHLSGENVAGGRWTPERRERIRESRVASTRLLAEAMARSPRPPRVWVCASAIGFYGSDAERSFDESAPAGSGFLAEVTREWEAATEPARRAGVRVVNLRIGLVLTPAGGVLGKMLPVFRWGVGGPIGDGRGWMSWISLDDLLGAIMHALHDETVSGAVNAVAPAPARNAEFTATLGRALHRPAVLRVPAFALRLALGRMAEETLLASTRAAPAVLARAGFVFRHPSLAGALAHLLARNRRTAGVSPPLHS